MTRPVLLLAASGLAREASSALDAAKREILGVLDDNLALAGRLYGGLPVLGPISDATTLDADLVVCAGKGASRRAIVGRLAERGVASERYTTVVDPSVRVGRRCTVGVGSILLAGTVLTADVTVGRHVVCMPQVTLTHDNVLEDFATLTAGVCLAGGVRVGEAAYIGMNATVREGRSIGRDAVLGMGAVLLTDQPDQTVFAGVPARRIKE